MTTATLSPLDAFLVDLLRAHGSPHADLTERTAARDAMMRRAYRYFADTQPIPVASVIPGVTLKRIAPQARVRMARTETRRPRRGLLRRAWEWVTS